MNERIRDLRVATHEIPTEFPESDGTFEWTATTVVVVEIDAGDRTGLGYTYADSSAALLVHDILRPLVEGRCPWDIVGVRRDLQRRVRNLGRRGIAALAISAVDCALWDLKARLLGLPLVDLLGAVRESVRVYGSGGFTSYDEERLTNQLSGWVDAGIPRVKMKVGREPEKDGIRVARVRNAIGPEAELFVDANGAYDEAQALRFAEIFAEQGVGWFEEPRPSDDLAALRRIRRRAPAGLEIAAGEYGWVPDDFRRILDAEAVDCLQADVTRCGGITGFLLVSALCEARHVPLSAHCAPAQHLHPCCASPAVRHVELFHDHVRIERMLFAGIPEPESGSIAPDRSRPGNGLELRREEALVV